jgi:hypothetical protein
MTLVVDLRFSASNFIFSHLEEGGKIPEFDANIQKWESFPNEMFSQLPTE